MNRLILVACLACILAVHEITAKCEWALIFLVVVWFTFVWKYLIIAVNFHSPIILKNVENPQYYKIACFLLSTCYIHVLTIIKK